MRKYQVMWLALGANMVAVIGCGSAGNGLKLPDPVPVKGTVKIDGETPLSNAVVSFIPEGGKAMGLGANAVTDASGAFELVTALGAKPTKGAVAGEYKVVISQLIDPTGSPVVAKDKPPADLAARESLPPRYSDAMMSELRASVSASGGAFDFKVTSR